MTENQLRYLAHQETVRHNLAGEGIDQGELEERTRSNQVREVETERSNRARETEAHRSNVKQEALKGRQLDQEDVRLDLAKAEQIRKTAETGANLGLKLVDAFVPG